MLDGGEGVVTGTGDIDRLRQPDAPADLHHHRRRAGGVKDLLHGGGTAVADGAWPGDR